MLHGHGKNPSQLLPFASILSQALPGAAFYLPQGPELVENQRWRWFSLEEYDADVARTDPEQRAAMLAAEPRGLTASSGLLHPFLDQVLAHHDLAAGRVVLAGFSQGAMLSLYAGLRYERQLGGILSLAGALYGLPSEIRSRPAVRLIHGADDDLLPPVLMDDAAAALRVAGVPHHAELISTMGHDLPELAIRSGLAFIQDVLK